MPFQPILFVGAGSQGAKIVSRIHEQMSKSKDEWVHNFYKYLILTSEVTPEEGVNENDIQSIHMAQPGLTIQAATKKLAGASGDDPNGFNHWWPQENGGLWEPAVKKVETGAGGIRCVGRALFHLNEGTAESLHEGIKGIRNNLERTHSALPDHQKHDVSKNDLICFVFAALAGGTSSGSILDIACVVREALSSSMGPYQAGYLAGVFLLADTCQQEPQTYDKVRTQNENAAHAIAELYFANCRHGRNAVAENWPARCGKHSVKPSSIQQGYNSIVFVGARNEFGKAFTSLKHYHEFIADYYVSFILSGEFRKNSARFVDQAQAIDQAERSYPNVPTIFGRIGRLGLRPPLDKIETMVRQGVAESLAHQFKNADADQDKNMISAFESGIGWNALHQTVQPPEFNLSIDEMGALPDTSEAFETEWKERKKQVESYFAGYTARESAPMELVTLVDEAKVALRTICAESLGFVTGHSFSLGSLAYFTKTMQAKCKQRITDLQESHSRLQQELFGQGGSATSLSTQFDATLNQLASDFPGKAVVNPFRALQRHKWEGLNEITTELNRYSGALRLFYGVERQMWVVSRIRADLDVLLVMVKLVGEQSGSRVVNAARHAVSALFEQSDDATQIWKDIIQSQEDIQRVFVDPMLLGLDSLAGAQSAGAAAKDRTLAKWIADPEGGLQRAWEDLASRLIAPTQSAQGDRQAGVRAVPSIEQILQDVRVRTILDTLRNGLDAHLRAATEETFRDRLKGLTVWTALTAYVQDVVRLEEEGDPAAQMPGRRAESVLKRLFKQYADEAKLFGKLEQGCVSYGDPARASVTLVGREQDAEKCFSALGITKKDFLSDLLSHALKKTYTFCSSSDETRRDLSFFLQEFGENPLDIDGCQRAKTLLLDAKNRQVGLSSPDDFQWADRRYPDWIAAWWKQSPPPDHLSL